jgi:hypothetical protein
MAELKTKPTNKKAIEFISGLTDEKRRQDATVILKMMQEITNENAVMWGDSIVGFGKLRYKYASGREGDWFLTGFSPRKQSLTLYLPSGFKKFNDLLSRLGKHKTSVACLYINKLADVDLNVLRELIGKAVETFRTKPAKK